MQIDPLNTYRVLDPVLDVREKGYYFFQGGETVDYTIEQATSSSNVFTQFNIFPPDIHTFVDRRMYLNMPVNIKFTGTTGGDNLLQNFYDAFRAYPLASVTQNLQLLINDVSANLEMNEYIDVIMRYNNDEKLRDHEYSLSPSQFDMSQDYEELVGSNRNPLNCKLEVPDGAAYPRGGFIYDENTFINTSTNAEIDAILTEPIFISPLQWGGCSSKGLYNVRQMKITFSWSNNLQRIWSHANNPGTSINTIEINFGNPEILVRYVKPFINFKIPKLLLK